MKYFITIDEQVALLKSRGLIIDDEDLAKKTLFRYNFYKVINGTYKIFTDNEKSKYYPNTKFEYLIEVYKFDKEIKKKLLGAALEVERILRSIVSYKFMEKHPEKAAYLDYRNFDNSNNIAKSNILSFEKAINQFREEINYHKSINHYLNKYGSVPLWFIINFISFGKLITFFESLKMEEKFEIADEFERFVEENIEEDIRFRLSPRILKSFLENAKELRNICAHDNLILGYTFELENIYYRPIHDIWQREENEKRNQLFDTFLILQALLPKDQFNSINQSMLKRINRLRERIPKNAFIKVMDSIGFPIDYNGDIL